MKTIMVTGGAGYIGSHTCVELLAQGYEVLIVDNLSNSSIRAVKRIEMIAGKRVLFYQQDLQDKVGLEHIFRTHSISAVIHFAGLKSVGESSQIPITYYQVNLISSLTLFEVMAEFHVFNLVFSSSATVYGDKNPIPYVESFPVSSNNPYGSTKVMIERFLFDAHSSNAKWNATLLRYFNPVGAHTSGQIGEDPKGRPNNLMPYITQVAVGKRTELEIYGGDYPTRDGTGVRDYIHVVDLAQGHLQALRQLEQRKSPTVEAYNLGSGKGYSVLEVVQTFERISCRRIPYRIAPRRQGDLAEFYADTSKARSDLNWHTTRSLEDMCRDAWNWQSCNPEGYAF